MTEVFIRRGDLNTGTHHGKMGVWLPEAKEPPEAGREAWTTAVLTP